MYQISIVMPTLYHSELTDSCFQSFVEKHDIKGNNIEFIIINNESDKKTSEVIEKYNFLDIKEFKQDQNLGVSASWNFGIKQCQYDKIAIINNDIEFTFPNSLYKMADTLDKYPNVYWTSPITHYEKNQKIILSFRRNHYEQLKYGSMSENYVVGCCFMCPKKSFDNIGIFDEKLSVRYYEDLDYINRILESGNKVRMTIDAAVYHAVGSTSRFVKGGEENESYYNQKWGDSRFDILKMQGVRKKGIKHFD